MSYLWVKHIFCGFSMVLNTKIRMLREQQNWTQEEMAERMQMSKNGYAKLERGESKLHLEKLEQIAQIFNIDILELINTGNDGFIFIGENSNNTNYAGSMISSGSDNEILKRELTHQKELNMQKEALLEQQKSEIASLKKLLALYEQNSKD